MDAKSISAIFYDAGYTLVYPVTGNWFIPRKFQEFFQEELPRNNPPEAMEAAFSHAYRFLNDHHHLQTEEEELAQFTQFYRSFLSKLNCDKACEPLYREIAEDQVRDAQRMAVYPDAFEHLKKMQERYRLAIISDTWPSLRRYFVELGLSEFFESMTISAELGTVKPDARMYRDQLDRTGLAPESCVFIDDFIGNCQGAVECGINAVQILRENNPRAAGTENLEIAPAVSDLAGLERLMG